LSQHHFVICVDNSEFEVSLEQQKIYESVPDPDDARCGLLRVIDESGEDYLFPSDRFMPIDLPRNVEA
jgi:hypothetical protein